MVNEFDFQRLSEYIGGVVDRKIVAVSNALTNSTGYLKSLLADAKAFALASSNSASDSSGYSVAASGYANSTALLWANFTSLYLGLKVNDPQLSQLGKPVTIGAFYVRDSDKHLRIATNNVNGVVTWVDAAVVADPDSVIAIADSRFLFLNKTTNQTVTGPVTFNGTTLVPRVADWSSKQAVPAIDLQTTTAILTNAVNDEKSRAEGIESGLLATIGAETSRATGAEDSIRDIIRSNQTDYEQWVNTEHDRAIAAEGVIADTVTAEYNRAALVENQLDGEISDLQTFRNSFSNGINEYGSWEFRPNIIEMWGRIFAPSNNEAITTVVLPFEMPDTNYNVSITPAVNVAGSRQDSWCQLVTGSITKSGFTVQYQADDADARHIDGYDWRIIARGVTIATTPTPTPSPSDPTPTPGGPTPTPTPTNPTPTPGGGGVPGGGGTRNPNVVDN